MRKSLPFILVGFVVLFVVLVQLYMPKTINWVPTFEKRDKNPYGDFILHDFLKDLFPGKTITVKDRTLYEELNYFDYTDNVSYDGDTPIDSAVIQNGDYTEEEQDSIMTRFQELDASLDNANTSVQELKEGTVDKAVQDEDDLKNAKMIPDLVSKPDSALRNYVIINGNFEPGETDVIALLGFVEEGNCAFIAAQSISGLLADTLNLKTNIGYYEEDFSTEDLKSGPKKDSIYLTLLNSRLVTKNKKYWYRDGTVSGYFSSVDTANTLILGKNSDGKANFIRISYGTGYFFLSATPLAYTNYNLILDNNAEYISASLSYLPVRDTYWDEYYKEFREKENNSLRFIENQPPLHWAYYIAFWSVFVYVLFESKRRQRVIPIIEPPKNTTVEFVSTIGRLYFQNGNHKDIASKKIHYFLEYIRTSFYLNTTDFDKEFIDKVSDRSGIDKTKVTQLFSLIHYLQRAEQVNQGELLELNKKLEEFRKESKVR